MDLNRKNKDQSSKDDAEAAYFEHLLKQSIEDFFRSPESKVMTEESEIAEALVAHWRKDFSNRFGEKPSYSMIYQCELGVRKIRALSHLSGETSKPVPQIRKTCLTNRPADTVERMKVEFWSVDQPKLQEPAPYPKLPAATSIAKHKTHAVKADTVSWIVGGLVLLTLVAFGSILVLSQRHELDRNIRFDASQLKVKPSSSLEVYQPDDSTQSHGSIPTSSAGGSGLKSSFNQPEANQNADSGLVDPSIASTYVVDTLDQTMEQARMGKALHQKSVAAPIPANPKMVTKTGLTPVHAVEEPNALAASQVKPIATQRRITAPTPQEQASTTSPQNQTPPPDQTNLLGMPQKLRDIFLPNTSTRFDAP